MDRKCATLAKLGMIFGTLRQFYRIFRVKGFVLGMSIKYQRIGKLIFSFFHDSHGRKMALIVKICLGLS